MKWGKVTLVIFCAVVITALGIDAADTLQGNSGTMLSQLVNNNETGPCPVGMVQVENIPTISCVDAYEASPSETCPVTQPTQLLHTRQNIEDGRCMVEAIEDALPWRFVTRDQAIQMCARAGKRLPTSAEWYGLSVGMASVEADCNVNSGSLSKSGAFEQCVSHAGVYDLVGNVWEWVSDDVIDGVHNARTLPDSGYVAQVDAQGMATMSSSTPSELFGADYFWSEQSGAYGVIRGGYYDSGSDGGIYTVHADTLPTTAATGIGFRCVI